MSLTVRAAARVRTVPQGVAKRTFDVLFGSALLLATLPMFLAVAAAVAMTSKGPVLFRQPRFGVNGRPFTMLKFRTMQVDAEERLARILADGGPLADEMRATWKLRKDPRVTPLGLTLRRLSLDELPQLLNVVRGDMSLVGPRPRRWYDELEGYGDDVDLLLSVRPGLTGPWQVSGRNCLPEETRVALDLGYARERSLWRDIVLLVRTVPTLLRPQRSGAC